MADLSGLGDLVLTVGGDISGLENALDQIPAAGQEAAAKIQAAFDAIPSASDDVYNSLANLSNSLSGAGDAANEATGSVMHLPPAFRDTSDAAAEATEKLTEFLKKGLELAGITLTLEALKEAIIGSLEAFGEMQVAIEAMTAMTKNAEAVKAAMEGIPDLANRIGASIGSLESAFTKFTRYGIDLEKIPGALERIADAAKGSGTAFDTAVSRWERAVNTGAIMSKTLQDMGVRMDDIARVMGMTGAAATDVTEAFRKIQDSADGTTAATQRLNILMAAVPENLRGLASSTEDVNKAFVQMKNAVTEAKETIGEALANLGTGGGLGALKIAIDIVVTAFVGLINVVAEFKDAAVGTFKIIYDASTALASAIGNLLTGNWKQALADLQTGGQKITDAWMAMGQQMADDFVKTGAIVAKTGGDISKNLNEMAGQAGEAGKKTGEAMNAVAESAKQLNQALVNAQNAFDKVAAAFAAGAAGPLAYAKALDELNKAQMEANGGFEQAATAAMLAANAYTQLIRDAANAQTTFNAVAADMAKGAANATQYSAALQALDAAQMALNNGLENAHTALLLAEDAYSKLGVTLANTVTKLDAAVRAFQDHRQTIQEVIAALDAYDTALRAVNGGLTDFQTQFDRAALAFQQQQVEAQNALISMQAIKAAYDEGRTGLEQYIKAIDEYIAKQKIANGGAVDTVTALAQVTDAHAKLALAVQNATTMLGAASTAFNRGDISSKEYQGYVDALAKAEENLTGVHQQTAAAASNVASAHDRLLGTFQQGPALMDKWDYYAIQINKDWDNYAATLNRVSADWDVLQTQIVTGSTGVNMFSNDVQGMNARLAQVPGLASSAAAGIRSIGSAAMAAAQETSIATEAFAGMAAGAGNLGKALDAAMTAKLGNINLSLKPGDQVSSPFQIGNPQSFLGLPAGWFSGAGPIGVGRPNENFTFDPGNNFVVKAGHAADNLNDAATKLQSAAQIQEDAAQQAYDAAKAATVASSRLGDAARTATQTNDAISASALAAADAANTAAMAANTAIVTSAGALTAVSAATQTIAASTALVATTAAVVAPAIGSAASTALIGMLTGGGSAVVAPTGPSGSNTMLGPAVLGSQLNPAAGVTLQVNVNNNGTLVGQGGMTQLANTVGDTIVKQLATQGIRLTRQ